MPGIDFQNAAAFLRSMGLNPALAALILPKDNHYADRIIFNENSCERLPAAPKA